MRSRTKETAVVCSVAVRRGCSGAARAPSTSKIRECETEERKRVAVFFERRVWWWCGVLARGYGAERCSMIGRFESVFLVSNLACLLPALS